jgi:hypothetical protein
MNDKPAHPVALRVDEISEEDARKLFEAAVKKKPRCVQVAEERMEYRRVHSDAARHVAEKIRQSIRAEDVMVFSAFGTKRVKVVLDLGMAEAFAAEVELGTNHDTGGKGDA